MAVLVPHFDLPFRLSGTSFAVTEQDSERDIGNCVETIIRTPYGSRDDNPNFGLDDHTFENQPLAKDAIIAQIEDQEPRSTILITETPDKIDRLIDNLKIEVNR